MNSRTDRDFWEAYRVLPAHVREAARQAYVRFDANPAHPSLMFKPLQGFDDVWSVRITLGDRALGIREGDTMTWFWIGSHADYDKLLGQR